MLNVFQIYKQLEKLPFAASRGNWNDRFFIVITDIEPRGKYGKAFGFSVEDGVPNEHVAYCSSWKKNMELPNVGSYQWRSINISDEELEALTVSFYNGVGKKYGFQRVGNIDREDEWFNDMLS